MSERDCIHCGKNFKEYLFLGFKCKLCGIYLHCVIHEYNHLEKHCKKKKKKINYVPRKYAMNVNPFTKK